MNTRGQGTLSMASLAPLLGACFENGPRNPAGLERLADMLEALFASEPTRRGTTSRDRAMPGSER